MDDRDGRGDADALEELDAELDLRAALAFERAALAASGIQWDVVAGAFEAVGMTDAAHAVATDPTTLTLGQLTMAAMSIRAVPVILFATSEHPSTDIAVLELTRELTGRD